MGTTLAGAKGFINRQRGKWAFASLFLAGKQLTANLIYTIVAGAANVSTIKIQAADGEGHAIAGVHELTVWLSDASTGIGLTGTAASGTVQAKANSGTDLGVLTAKKALRVLTLADGSYTLEITAAAKTGYYVAASVPATGNVVVSRVLVAGDYGA